MFDRTASARERFPWWSRVRPSALGIKQIGLRPSDRGAVSGYSRDNYCIYIQPSQTNWRRRHYHGFWELDN